MAIDDRDLLNEIGGGPSMSESGWKAAALCATESRGAQLEAVVRPWAQAEAADSAALDTQARRSPATSCAPTRAPASLPG